MRYNFLCIFIFLAQSVLVFGQHDVKLPLNIFSVFEQSKDNGYLIISQDERIAGLVNQYVDFRKKESRIPGYRIRIFSNSGQTARAKANEERTRFLKLYPDVPTYLEYEAPNFKIYIGDYRSKIEAFQAYKAISKDFKNAFLVPLRINLPKL